MVDDGWISISNKEHRKDPLVLGRGSLDYLKCLTKISRT